MESADHQRYITDPNKALLTLGILKVEVTILRSRLDCVVGSERINGDPINGLVISPSYKCGKLGVEILVSIPRDLWHILSEDEQGVSNQLRNA